MDDEGVDDGSKLTETVAAELNAVGAEDAKGDPSPIAASEVEAGDPEAEGRAVEVAENADAENVGGESLGTDAPADTNQPGTSDAAPEGSGIEVATASDGDPSGTDSAEELGTGRKDSQDLKPLPRQQYGIILVSNG